VKHGGWWSSSFFGWSWSQGVLGCGWCWVLFMVVVGSIIGCCVTGHCNIVVVVSEVGWDEHGTGVLTMVS